MIELADKHLTWIRQGLEALAMLSLTNAAWGIDMSSPREHKPVAQQIRNLSRRITLLQEEAENHYTDAFLYMGVFLPDENVDYHFTFNEWNQLCIAITLTSRMCEYMEDHAKHSGSIEKANEWRKRGDDMSELQNDIWSVRSWAIEDYYIEQYGRRVVGIGISKNNNVLESE